MHYDKKKKKSHGILKSVQKAPNLLCFFSKHGCKWSHYRLSFKFFIFFSSISELPTIGTAVLFLPKHTTHSQREPWLTGTRIENLNTSYYPSVHLLYIVSYCRTQLNNAADNYSKYEVIYMQKTRWHARVMDQWCSRASYLSHRVPHPVMSYTALLITQGIWGEGTCLQFHSQRVHTVWDACAKPHS